jgi:acetyltransferase
MFYPESSGNNPEHSQRKPKKGLGTHLVELLVGIGRQEGTGRIVALIMPENHVMQQVFRKAGFEVKYDSFNEAIRAEIRLGL